MTKRCSTCEKAVQADDHVVYDATIWTSEGNFGSGVYDPMSGDVFLEAVICDACLIGKKGLIEEVKAETKVSGTFFRLFPP